MATVFLSLGSNLGNRQQLLTKAKQLILKEIGVICKASSIYTTLPWGFESSDLFYNQVICCECYLKPQDILDKIHEIEIALGRVRDDKKKTGYSSRVIDIDILFIDDLIINGESLQVPHPLLHERQFVLVPFVELDRNFKHPVLKKTIAELTELCKDRSMPVKVK